MPRKPHDPNYYDGTVALGISTAGSSQSDATGLPANWNYVDTNAAETQGVRAALIPLTEKGGVVNATATPFVLYPPVGVSFNGLTANVGVSIAPRSGAWWIAINATKYAIFPGGAVV